jgi:hypothetical protein
MQQKTEKLSDEQRINKIRGSQEYKSKTKDSVESIKRYLWNVHKRNITNKDVKIVKYLITPV